MLAGTTPTRAETRENSGGPPGTRNEYCRDSGADTEASTRLDPLPGAKDARDLSEQLVRTDGGILRRERVASGD
jgi:hypothetical protein